MSKQIIKQPNGLFAVFSSNTGTIHLWDATAGALMSYVEQLAQEAAEQVRERYRKALTAVDEERPRDIYAQFAMTWQEALAEDRANDGEVWRHVE